MAAKVKGKIFPCVFLTEHHAMKVYWGVEVYLHAFLDSALDGGEWSVSITGRFTPSERVSVTHWIGSWVGPSAGLDTVVKRIIHRPYRDLNPRSSNP
jgi:hypothetical protein